MTQQISLPFKVDQIIEVKSFQSGYRGAWFQCKILDITERKELYYNLEYLDYPGERKHRTKVFQKFPRGLETCLMVRPSYPPHYHESEHLKIEGDREPLLVIHGSWKVGDLVDWRKDGCYWSGKVSEVKENGALQIELPPPPIGQGNNYEALCKDLRPTLEWSLDDGWKLPSMDGQNRQCAKLVKRKNEEITDVCRTGKEQMERPMQQHTQRPTQEQKERATQQLKVNGDLRLNIMESDLIEAAVYDLEELIVRIEWLKGMLNQDVAEDSKSYWQYEDYRPSSTGM